MVLFRVRPHFRGMGKVPDRRSRFMLVNNHLSIFDEFALIYAFRNHDVLYVSKVENFDIPVAGPWFKKAGCLPIKQGDLLDGAQVISRGVEEIKSKRHSICIAPEGTRNKDPLNSDVASFHAGTFRCALKSKCPVLIASIFGTFRASNGKYFAKYNPVRLEKIKVLEYEDIKDMNTEQISEYAYQLINDDVKKAKVFDKEKMKLLNKKHIN